VQAFALTGASSSQAYQMVERLRRTASTLMGKPGRPPSQRPPDDSLLKVSKAIQQYLMRFPGSARETPVRTQYSDGFRCFIVGLIESGQPGEGLSIAGLAEATTIPLVTLNEWFGRKLRSQPAPEEPALDSLEDLQVSQVLTLYESWKGSLVAFCQMVREQHHLKFGMTFIGNLLHKAGLRYRKPQKPKQAPWTHGTYRVLYPGAQWLGDGTSVAIEFAWYGEKFVFNLEAVLDVASNALMGFAVSDFEDEEVVLRAYKEDAVPTAGAAPLSHSLDNRYSNHTEAIVEALGTTTLLRTTLGRGESKAPLEGTFGLFKQALPALLITGQTRREQARSILELVFTAWARGRNGRPRKKLGNNVLNVASAL